MFKSLVSFHWSVNFTLMLVIVAYIIKTDASLGIDFSDPISVASLACLKESGYDFTIVRAFRSSGIPDENAPASIRNARLANISSVEVYMFPCPKCGNAQKQVDDMLSLNLSVDIIWIDVEIYNWFASKAKNREFFEELIKARFGANRIGIYTSYHSWETLMGLDYTFGSRLPLWYAHYNYEENFDDFRSFGGWVYPVMKQFAPDESRCGANVDLNYRELSVLN